MSESSEKKSLNESINDIANLMATIATAVVALMTIASSLKKK